MTSGFRYRLRAIQEKARLHGNAEQHEQTDRWSNRDLIPLPPHRRTWGWFHFFGFWTIASLNITNWQIPSTFLTQGLSVSQSMAVILVANMLIVGFSTLVAWCGLRWHIGFTIQNRFTWGLRGSYLPLALRVLLNFLWNAMQCWNGGRQVAVCLTAIWPGYARFSMNDSDNDFLPAVLKQVTNGGEFVGFVVFWVVSVPFLWLPPEKFKIPFLVTSVWCGAGMLVMMAWALAAAGGTVGPLLHSGVAIPEGSRWSAAWLMMGGVNQAIAGITAGISNGSDFSRYAKSWRSYVVGSVSCGWVVGTLVSFVGLVTTSAAQVVYGQVYWNPPDLLLAMIDNGGGTRAARVGVFFLAFGFALASLFENMCGNVIAGGIDLAGLVPHYINIRRGAIITFLAAWIIQPWQLINRASTFIQVLSSFSVFLSPIIGLMAADFYLVRGRQVRLSHLYRTDDTIYWYWHGINWRAFPSWVCGWAPTIGGLVVTVRQDPGAPRSLYQVNYMSFFIGFFTGGIVFYALNKLFPVGNLGEYDEIDLYGTFTTKEAENLGVVPIEYQTDGLESRETSALERSEKQ